MRPKPKKIAYEQLKLGTFCSVLRGKKRLPAIITGMRLKDSDSSDKIDYIASIFTQSNRQGVQGLYFIMSLENNNIVLYEAIPKFDYYSLRMAEAGYRRKGSYITNSLKKSLCFKDILPSLKIVWKIFETTLGKSIISISKYCSPPEIKACTYLNISMDYSGYGRVYFQTSTFTNSVSMPILMESILPWKIKIQNKLEEVKESIRNLFKNYSGLLDRDSNYYNFKGDKKFNYFNPGLEIWKTDEKIYKQYSSALSKKYITLYHALLDFNVNELIARPELDANYFKFCLGLYSDVTYILRDITHELYDIIRNYMNEKKINSEFWTKVKKMTNPSVMDLLEV